jgi:TPR repeat protein
LYEEGVLTPRNLLEALQWYTRAYLQECDDISPELSAMYEDKPYEDFFFKKLFRNLSIASCGDFNLTTAYSDKDYFGINSRLGSLYFFGQGTIKDMKKAWGYITKTHIRNDSPVTIEDLFYALPRFRSSELHGILKQFAEDDSFLHEMKKENLYELGMIFFDGLSGYKPAIERSHSRAFKSLKKAADKQYPEAILQLGIMYHCGYGVHQDIRRGEELFNNAASKDVELLGRIAMLYHTHEDFQNFTKAFEWYKHLEQLEVDNESDYKIGDIICSIGYERSHLGLGILYEYGDGVQQDYEMAIKYYDKLTKYGSLIGCYRLGLMFYYGKGVSTDYKEALQNFKKEAHYFEMEYSLPFVYDQTDSDGSDSGKNRLYCTVNINRLIGEAYYKVAVMYKNGLGAPPDKEEAQLYFREALDYGCEHLFTDGDWIGLKRK